MPLMDNDTELQKAYWELFSYFASKILQKENEILASIEKANSHDQNQRRSCVALGSEIGNLVSAMMLGGDERLNALLYSINSAKLKDHGETKEQGQT
jgi:hypothetical protein